jgi:two-component system phosphate regulon sensor histidine kinase PhoR
MFQRRLLWQLYPWFLLIIVISVASVAWYASQSIETFYLQQIREDLTSRARLVQEQVQDNLDSENHRAIDNLCKQIGKASSTRITVILPDGKVIADSDENPARMENHIDRPEIQDALAKDRGSYLRSSDTLGIKMMYLAIAVKQDNQIQAIIRTSVPVTDIKDTLGSIYQKLFWAGAVIAVCAAVISLAISKRISRPVEDMTQAATHFADGELDHRMALPDTMELAELAKALNKMAEQLNARINMISEERSQIQTILSSMIEGVLAVDSAGHIVSINKAAADFLDLDETGSVGRNIEEVVRNPQLQQYINDILENKQPPETNVFINNDGGRSLQLHGSGLANKNGNRNGAVLVLHDITRTRQLEEVRRDFVANVSHELKTPVTSIKGFIETLLDGSVKEPQQMQRFLEIIAKHADRLNAIIEDLLSLSRLEEESNNRKLSFETINIRPALASAIELSKPKAGQKNIALELSCDEEIVAQINSILIEQAVVNLIDNAVKYSPDSSTIHIIAESVANEIVISVSDQGCGIAKEHLGRLFERFYVVDKGRSRKLGGTGLGLSIVKHIAQVHGGTVEVQSAVGKGSTFTVHLPA